MLPFMNNGSKYTATQDLDIKEIAKLVRADIKVAIAEGVLLAGIKCSVKIDRYSMGQSLDVYVTAFPEQIWTDEFITSNPLVLFEGERMTAIARSTVRVLERMVAAYNQTDIDSQSDYHCVRFHGGAGFHWELEKADREASKARLGVAAA